MKKMTLSLIFVMISTVFAVAQNPNPQDIFREVIKKMEGKKSAEFEVKDVEGTRFVKGSEVKTRAKVKGTILFGSPFKFTAKTIGEGNEIYQFATHDGTKYRYSDLGVAKEFDSAAGYPGILAISDPIWANHFLTPKHYRDSIEKNTLVWGGNDEIENEPCDIIINISVQPNRTITEYIWVSKQTRRPRGWQFFTITNGKTVAPPRKFISNIVFDVETNDAAFSYAPTAKDSVAVVVKESDKTTPGIKTVNLVGRNLPEANLQLFDGANTQVPISKYLGKPTLITFWATWCGPCLSEMPIFQKVADAYQGKMQVLAVAAIDTKVGTQNFINKNPKYKFEWLIDPDWQMTTSPLMENYGIKGLPFNLFIDAKGKVIEQWLGSGTDAEIVAKLQRLMKVAEPTATAKPIVIEKEKPAKTRVTAPK